MKNITRFIVSLGLLAQVSCQNQQELIEVEIPERQIFSKESNFPDPNLVKTTSGPFTMEGLPFKYNEITSFLSATNVELHYSKHHLDHANTLNKLMEQNGLQQNNIEAILKKTQENNAVLLSEAGGFYNHNLFWKSISKTSTTKPSAILSDALSENFNSFEQFKTSFKNKARAHIGSGWVWVLYNKGNIEVITTQNNDTPYSNIEYKEAIPLLVLDLWEHAYYPTYQNNRSLYIDEFINHIDWNFVSSKFETHIE